MFGVVRQASGDLQGLVHGSLVSAQLPNREALLSELSQSKKLPSAAKLEELWYVLQQEIIESGNIARFKSEIIAADGSSKQANVIRIGAFSAIADGKFLRYDSEKGKLIELARQPEGRLIATAEAFGNANTIAPMVIDPTRGAILGMLVDKPTLEERIEQGGVVGYIIIALGVLGILFAVIRFVLLSLTQRSVDQQLKSIETPLENNPLGRVLKVYDANKDADTELLESKLDEAILKETPRLKAGEPLIKLLAAVAPLLGLLGTVTGMIATFQAITLFGTGDPKLMAGGISQALVTTVLGLVAAIPLLFSHSLVSARSRGIITILDQHSAGLIAERMEKDDAGRA